MPTPAKKHRLSMLVEIDLVSPPRIPRYARELLIYKAVMPASGVSSSNGKTANFTTDERVHASRSGDANAVIRPGFS